ncbi:MAG TPA: (Fe-S)-binding protein [Anaerolineae bacterium]|nr:(Fe-S)-binding protein [Anaerolineae bacterium]
MSDTHVEPLIYKSSEMVSGGQSASCIRCGLCLATCPVYRVTLKETDTPRGKIALLRAVNEGRLDPGQSFASRFYDCLLCGACANVCPSGVELEEILQAARDDLTNHKLQPEALARLGRVIWEHHNISGEDNAHRLIWTENMDAPPLGAEPKERADVAYFVGCVGSFFPRSYRLPQTMAQLLEKGGVDYALLGGKEWCCGYPLLINGQVDEAGELIEHNLAAVRALGASKVVFTCPSCLHIWHHVYTQVAGGALPFELMHATELLASLIDDGTLRFRQQPAQRVTYHDPCDLGRKEGIFDAPRRVLRAIPGIELVEMVDNRANSHCCGGGGNLETFDPDLSHAVSDRRLRQAQDVSAQVIASACQQCERTLTEAARRNKVRLRVLDVAEMALTALEE